MEPLDAQHGHAMAVSPALLALVSKPEPTTYSEVASDSRAEWWQTTHQSGMSPSYHHLLSPWLPMPFDQPIGPSETTAPFPERRYRPLVVIVTVTAVEGHRSRNWTDVDFSLNKCRCMVTFCICCCALFLLLLSLLLSCVSLLCVVSLLCCVVAVLC